MDMLWPTYLEKLVFYGIQDRLVVAEDQDLGPATSIRMTAPPAPPLGLAAVRVAAIKEALQELNRITDLRSHRMSV
jgi:hypothetical protein